MIRPIITGVTGMVGEGVLHVCLEHPDVGEILILGRRPYGMEHPKIREAIAEDFMDLGQVREQFDAYNACFFCVGVSSIGMKEEEYTRLTYDLTMHVARAMCEQNPDMVFCYVSGAGTDSSEQGRSMWARVKGRTENALMRLPFRGVYNFRPGIITPMKGMKNTLSFYKYISWLIPVIRAIAPRFVISLREIGLAMIRVASEGYGKQVLECNDIANAAGKQ